MRYVYLPRARARARPRLVATSSLLLLPLVRGYENFARAHEVYRSRGIRVERERALRRYCARAPSGVRSCPPWMRAGIRGIARRLINHAEDRSQPAARRLFRNTRECTLIEITTIPPVYIGAGTRSAESRGDAEPWQLG